MGAVDELIRLGRPGRSRNTLAEALHAAAAAGVLGAP
jgi:hypothetical protein